MQQKPQGTLVRDIHFFGVAFLVLNGMIGAGIFALPWRVAANAGGLSPWLFLIVGVLFVAVVLSFAELSSYFRESGGQALYVSYAFGPLAGFSTGWLLYLSKITSFAANANVMVVYLALLVPWVGTGVGRFTFIAAYCGFLIFINVIGVKDGIRAMGVMTFFKMAPLLLLILLGLPHVSGNSLLFSEMPTINDFGGTILLVVYAFVGFETALVTAGETSNPRRTIPRALLMTIIATAVFYFLITLVYISVLPEGGASKLTLVDVGQTLAGPIGALAITIAAVFSIGSNLSVAMIATPRLSLSLAESGTLPDWFGRIHKKYSTPHHSIIFFGVVAFIFAVTGSFVILAVATSLARLLTYFISIAALPVVRKKSTTEMAERAYRLKGGNLIPFVGLVICAWMIAQAEVQSWSMLGVLLVIGLAMFWLKNRSFGVKPL